MSSTPQYLKCYQCKANPSQFTFLNCNHIYCSDCFLDHVEKSKKYSLVNCSCGAITYFNDDNQIVQSFKASNISKGSPKSSTKMFESKQTKANTKKQVSAQTLQNLQFSSIFSLQRQQSKQNKKQLQKQQINKNQHSLLLNKKSKDQKQFYKKLKNLQKTALQSSLQQEQQKSRSNNWINQFSTHNICEDSSNHVVSQQKYLKHKNSRIHLQNNNNFKNDQNVNSKVHEEFKREIDFLKILFQKQVNQVVHKFKSILQGFREQYQKMQNQLKTLYLQNILTKQTSSLLNLAHLVKNKYMADLGNKIKLLKDQLFYTERANSKQIQNKSSLLFEQIKQRTKMHQTTNNDNHNMKSRNNVKLCNPFEVVKQQQSQPYQQNQYRSRIKNYKFNKIQKDRLNQQTNNPNFNYNQDYIHSKQFSRNNHRVQTEHLNTHVKKPKMNKFCQRPTNGNYEQESQIESNFKNRSYLQQKQNSLDQHKLRKHIIYYSPPLPYCYKHYQKKSRQARNYINQIQNLCKAKKLKNSKDLFKKFKNDKHEFSYRFQ